MNTLYELGIKYNTDKSTYHLFTVIYDFIFSKYRNNNLTLLEIGIHNGSSLKMWEEYFVNSKIYGADILNKSELNSERIETFIINQEIVNDLKRLPIDCDIIIDDGGHTMIQQQITFNELFNNNLKNKGIFVIEDLHTSNSEYFSTHGSNYNNNTLNLLYDLKIGKKRMNSDYYINDEDFQKLYDSIRDIEIFKIKNDSITSFIYKK